MELRCRARLLGYDAHLAQQLPVDVSAAVEHQAVALDSDHHVAEEVPAELAAVLAAFLDGKPVPGVLDRAAYRHRN